MITLRIEEVNGKRKYALYEDHGELAHFDNFATAAIVCRFIKSGWLEKAEYAIAVQAMSNFDKAGMHE